MIRFKLTRKDRTSCIIHPKSQFCQKYLKGKIVTADPETLGIFTFKTEQEAKNFRWPRDFWLILKVKPIGKGKSPKKISHDTDQRSLIRFFKKLLDIDTMRAPRGTICYPAVKVLD